MDSESFDQLCYYISKKYQLSTEMTKSLVCDIYKFKPILKSNTTCEHVIYSDYDKNIVFCIKCRQNWSCFVCNKIIYYENIYGVFNRSEKVINCKHCNRKIKTEVCKTCSEYNCNGMCNLHD